MSNIIVGKFFHSFDEDGYYEWQGKVLSHGSGFVLVQLYEWLSGGPSCQKLVPETSTTTWHFYNSDAEMRNAGLYPDSSPQTPELDRELNKRQKVPNRIRFQIFKRDGYRCRICGKDGELEIDHKIPVASGGDNSESNLWTLCFDCNRGKNDSGL